MKAQAVPPDDSGRHDPGVVEMILLGAVRLASLPFLVFVIVLASLIYGVAGLARFLMTLTASGFHRAGGAARPWDRPAKPQDA